MTMQVCYTPKRFNDEHLAIIAKANDIIEEYQAQGYSLTLRQLYYQFVARDMLPNTQQSYKRLGGILADARLAGLVDWSAMVDRTRSLKSNSHWDSPAEIVQSCAAQFRYDLWADQPTRVEVWIEKDALIGVIEDACRGLDVPFFSCRGYTSLSEMWVAGMRIVERYDEHGQGTHIIHLGDHDPSGIDMTRDVLDRLTLFAETHGADAPVIERIALNMDQVEEYGPPPNPAKMTDSRAGGYVTRFGYDSWELDALEPRVLAKLVSDHVEAHIEQDKWAAALERQQAARDALEAVAAEMEDDDEG